MRKNYLREEDKIIRFNWHELSLEEICKLLLNRTEDSVARRARMLGLRSKYQQQLKRTYTKKYTYYQEAESYE